MKRAIISIIVLSLITTPLTALAQEEDAATHPIAAPREKVKRVIQERAEIEHRAQQKREALRERATKTRERIAERRARLDERRKQRIRAFFKRMHARLEAALNRMEKLAHRVESRIKKLEEKNKNIQTAEARRALAQAREHIKAGKDALKSLPKEIDALLESDADHRTKFERFKILTRQVVEQIRAAHKALVNSVRSLKAGIPHRDTSTTTPPTATTTPS